MGKASPDVTIDPMLTKIATATRMTVLSAEPANFAGIAAVLLADATMTAGDGNDYTIADGDTSGRKVTVAAKADQAVDTSGTATHVALDDGVDLLYVTTCTSQALSDTGTVSIPAWDVEVADPV